LLISDLKSQIANHKSEIEVDRGLPLADHAMGKRRWRLALGVVIPVLAGCAHRIPSAPTPQVAPAHARQLPFIATAYCTTGITASGVPVSRGIAAADPALLPLGTVIRVTGAAPYDGTYRILDTGALVRRRHVDLFIPDCGAAREFGRRSVHVVVVRQPR
jgi:3D (Asp-Asp-Asp) domain-containing protein